MAASIGSNSSRATRIVLAFELGGNDVGPVLFDLAAIAAFGEAAHQTSVVVLVLADYSEMRVRSGAHFLLQVAGPGLEEPQPRGAILVGRAPHRLNVAVRALDGEHTCADLIELFPQLLFRFRRVWRMGLSSLFQGALGATGLIRQVLAD